MSDLLIETIGLTKMYGAGETAVVALDNVTLRFTSNAAAKWSIVFLFASAAACTTGNPAETSSSSSSSTGGGSGSVGGSSSGNGSSAQSRLSSSRGSSGQSGGGSSASQQVSSSRAMSSSASSGGTSTATPFVSAAVAFAAAHYPAETAVQRVARVLNGTSPVGALAGRVLTGGRLDLTGILDADRDQMPDWWETEQFGATTATAGADPDGDGFSNLQEYRTGTLPNNPFSRFALSQSGIAVNGTQKDFFVTFPTARDVTYRVERSDTLASGSWTALGPDIPGTGNPATVTDPNAPALHPRRFYRVRIISP